MSWLIYSAALLPLIGLMLLLAQQRRPDTAVPGDKPFSRWLGALPVYRDRGNVWRAARNRSRRIAGLSLLLRRAGITNPRDQLALCSSAVFAALLIGASSGVLVLLTGKDAASASRFALAAAAGLLLLATLITRGYAARRQIAIGQEAPMVIQVTRMLWRAGLSLPRIFAVLCEELQQLAPATTRELRSALQKIETGQNQEEALAELVELTTAEGFREYLVITRQVSQSGGGVDQALADLYQLLQHRRRTELQEKVSKLSAKMSVVMMLLLFPTLMIVLGGPGFIAIGGALARLGAR
jgi:tight adherence protein C